MALRYISDPGHGWLEVSMKELRRVGVANKVSPYSYRVGHTAYLEEDCDMPLYLRVLEARGEPRPVLVEVYEEDSPIRDYRSYWF